MTLGTLGFNWRHFLGWLHALVLALGLTLLAGCGSGSSGGAAVTPAAVSAPSLSLTRSDNGSAVYPGNVAKLLPQFNYGSANLSWVDSSNVTHTQPVVAGTPVDVTPSSTTTYTLTVTYQDPTTVRSTSLTTSTTLQVSVVTPPSLMASMSLNATPTGSITRGTQVQLTPTFTLPSGLTLSSSDILVNNDASAAIHVTTGTAVFHTPTIDTVYTLKVCYVDTRVVPNVTNCESTSLSTIRVVASPTKLSTGGLMNVARSDFTTTALQNGMILVTGGINASGGVEKSVELYDPVNNNWIRTGDMKTARRGHSATLLRDGRVLVTGGYDGTVATTALNKAETYDPSTGVWTNTSGTLSQARRWHTSTLLNNDKVLIVGGAVSSGSGTVVELFDPVSGTFSNTGSLHVPRQGHSATLLPDGRVLVAGRNNSDASIMNGVDSSRTTEIFDTTATTTGTINTWGWGPNLTNGRYQNAATLIGNTNLLMLSGGYGASINNTAELLDVSGTTVTQVATTTMGTARALHTSTFIPSTGQVLITGGYNTSTGTLTSTESFVLNTASPASSTWTNTGNKELVLARAMHSGTLLSNGFVLVVGTYYTTSGTTSNTCEIWSP